jgi:hypothetical protein
MDLKDGSREDLNRLVEERVHLIEGQLQELISQKDYRRKQIQEIDVRITQLVGAINELKSLVPVKQEAEETAEESK